jgi:hypothetical protein
MSGNQDFSHEGDSLNVTQPNSVQAVGRPLRHNTLQRKFHLCIPFLGIEQSQSQFHIHHVSVSDLYISRIGPHVLLQQNRQTDPGNI